MSISLKELAKFLVEAKTKGGYGFGKEITPWRKGFKELEYKKGDFYYRDSYCGSFFAPGQEVVYYKNEPVWAMAYSGGMNFRYHRNEKFANDVYGFLKKALALMPVNKPFRGPARLKSKEFVYTSKVTGNIRDFSGVEKITYKGSEVFRQNYIGGLIISK
jgi:hypothetical protein